MRRSFLFSSAFVGLSWALPRAALACGGLFCQPAQPVIQTGEQIIFSVDRAAGTVDAVINIRYSGPAEDFAWVLPLQSAPTQTAVGPQSAFQTVNRLTGPQFNLQFETKGRCREGVSFGSVDEASVPAQAESGGRGGVEVVSRQEVGPYESVVLAGSSADEIRAWLVDNGFAVTEEMMRQVVPYVQKGDVLMALKLRKNNDAGDIQPIHVTMSGNEVCVPIRLTAIAAMDDMDITVTVLSSEGRAVPENFFEVEMNWAKLDWFSRGANYRELVGLAADEGTGNAFTTEFAGSARVFDGQIYPDAGYDRSVLLAAGNFTSLLNALGRAGLIGKPGLGPILRRYAEGALKDELDSNATRFDACPQCFAGLSTGSIDVDAVIDEVWTRIVKPEQTLQALFDARSYATRLYTLLSPEEMTIDPEFVFRPDLEDVSNVHVATSVRECGFAGQETRRYLRIEDTGQEVDLDRLGELQDAMPASRRVRQLAEGVDFIDNRPEISRILGDNLGCAGVQPADGSWLAIGLLGLMWGWRRRRA